MKEKKISRVRAGWSQFSWWPHRPWNTSPEPQWHGFPGRYNGWILLQWIRVSLEWPSAIMTGFPVSWHPVSMIFAPSKHVPKLYSKALSMKSSTAVGVTPPARFIILQSLLKKAAFCCQCCDLKQVKDKHWNVESSTLKHVVLQEGCNQSIIPGPSLAVFVSHHQYWIELIVGKNVFSPSPWITGNNSNNNDNNNNNFRLLLRL